MGRTTFDLSSVQRALGMKVGVGLPSMQTDSMMPVVLLADFSRSFAAEAFESRGVLGSETLSGDVLNRPVIELKAISPGGVVIEEVRVFHGVLNGLASARVTFLNQVNPIAVPLAPIVDPENIIEIGGDPVTSVGRSFALVGEPSSAGIPVILDAGSAAVTNMGWFLPSGRVFRINGTLAPTSTLAASIQFREIPVSVGSE